jgi:hypothetical protein
MTSVALDMAKERISEVNDTPLDNPKLTNPK